MKTRKVYEIIREPDDEGDDIVVASYKSPASVTRWIERNGGASALLGFWVWVGKEVLTQFRGWQLDAEEIMEVDEWTRPDIRAEYMAGLRY